MSIVAARLIVHLAILTAVFAMLFFDFTQLILEKSVELLVAIYAAKLSLIRHFLGENITFLETLTKFGHLGRFMI